MEAAGVHNCFQVTTNVYRGAQPTATGFQHLKMLRIKTAVYLHARHSDRNKVADAGLKSVRSEMDPWRGNEEEVVPFQKLATDTKNLTAFVQCERGADRTGRMCAMYRITVCGWTKQQAIDEMKHGGVSFSPDWHALVTFRWKVACAILHF